MKIAICTSYRKEIEYFAVSTSINKKLYCDAHGYDFIEETNILDNTRAFYWDKLKVIQKNINNYDWLSWIDADAAITNFDIKIEDYIDPNYDIIISRQIVNGDLLNTGVFLIKNSKWTNNFLEKWYSQEQFAYIPYHEQSAFIHLYDTEEDTRKHTKVIKQKGFNSFPSIWSKDDFIVHFAGISNRLPLIAISLGDFSYLTYRKFVVVGIGIGIAVLGYLALKKKR